MVLPILLMIFAAIIEICRLLLLQQTADTAAYEGARHALVPGANVEEGMTETRRLLTQARVKHPRITITPETITESTAAITVHVSIPMSENSWFFTSFGDLYSVTSEVTLLCERVPMVQLTGIPSIKAKAKAKSKKKVKPQLEL